VITIWNFRTLIDNISNKGPLTGILSSLKIVLPDPFKSIFHVLEEDFENDNPPKLSFIKRIRAYKLGLTRKLYQAYGIPTGSNPDFYISEFERNAYTKSINPDPDILDNKKRFYENMEKKGYENYLPELLGTIKQGELQGDKELTDILNERDKFVLKSFYGGAGNRVYILEKSNDGFLVNKERKINNLNVLLDESRNYMLTEYNYQAKFLGDIYPNSANTIRLLTMFPENEDPFIASGILRIGTKKSGVKDNIAEGGLTAPININTGIIGSAAKITSRGKVKFHEKHPDTNSNIEGIKIPKWEDFKSEFISLVSKFPEFKYVGWDVLFVDKKNFVILEGNSHSDVYIFQVHEPLLKDKKNKKFYKKISGNHI